MRSKQLIFAFLMILVLLAAGCKKKEPYLGTYKFQMTPEMQKQIDDGMKKAKGTPGEALVQTLVNALKDMSVTLKEEGKCTLTAMGQSKDSTYTVDGNSISIKPDGSTDKGGTVTVFIYDEAKQELSVTQNGQKVILKKEADAAK